MTNGEIRLNAPVDGKADQHWDIVPTAAWEEYKAWKETDNSLTKAYYYDMVLGNFLKPIIGMSMDDYTESVKHTKSNLADISEELESLDDDFGTAKQVGG